MAILPVTVYGDKILRKKTSPVEEVDMKTIELIKNMFDTMRNASGVGLAANQVGVDEAIFVVDISVVDGYEHIKPMVFINPEIVETSEETVDIEEGCLSIPDIRHEINRPEKVKIKYYDVDMKEQIIEADELLARVIQHEYDHLQGVLFIDKLSEAALKKIKNDLAKIKSRRVDTDYPISEKMDYILK
ncbi:MAG: peptide deformylase [Ignavibacteriaceae bacterium]